MGQEAGARGRWEKLGEAGVAAEERAEQPRQAVRQRPPVRTSAGQQGRGGSGRRRHRSYAARAVSPCVLDRKPFHGFRLGQWGMGGRCGGGCGDLTLMRASAMALCFFVLELHMH